MTWLLATARLGMWQILIPITTGCAVLFGWVTAGGLSFLSPMHNAPVQLALIPLWIGIVTAVAAWRERIIVIPGQATRRLFARIVRLAVVILCLTAFLVSHQAFGGISLQDQTLRPLLTFLLATLVVALWRFELAGIGGLLLLGLQLFPGRTTYTLYDQITEPFPTIAFIIMNVFCCVAYCIWGESWAGRGEETA